MQSKPNPYPQHGMKPCKVCKCDRSTRTMDQWRLTRCWLCKWQLSKCVAKQLEVCTPSALAADLARQWDQAQAQAQAGKKATTARGRKARRPMESVWIKSATVADLSRHPIKSAKIIRGEIPHPQQ